LSRATPTLVKAILTDVDPTIDVTSFIDLANDIVNESCLDSGYSEARLTRIETWLAAHFYCINDPRTTSENAGRVGVQYENQVGKGFELTRYGQQALLIDTAGNLAHIAWMQARGGRRKVRMVWLGEECPLREDEDNL
jgi:hypothetical protein